MYLRPILRYPTELEFWMTAYAIDSFILLSNYLDVTPYCYNFCPLRNLYGCILGFVLTLATKKAITGPSTLTSRGRMDVVCHNQRQIYDFNNAPNAMTTLYVSECRFSRWNGIYAPPLTYHWKGYTFTYIFFCSEEGNFGFNSTKRLSIIVRITFVK